MSYLQQQGGEEVGIRNDIHQSMKHILDREQPLLLSILSKVSFPWGGPWTSHQVASLIIFIITFIINIIFIFFQIYLCTLQANGHNQVPIERPIYKERAKHGGVFFSNFVSFNSLEQLKWKIWQKLSQCRGSIRTGKRGIYFLESDLVFSQRQKLWFYALQVVERFLSEELGGETSSGSSSPVTPLNAPHAFEWEQPHIFVFFSSFLFLLILLPISCFPIHSCCSLNILWLDPCTEFAWSAPIFRKTKPSFFWERARRSLYLKTLATAGWQVRILLVRVPNLYFGSIQYSWGTWLNSSSTYPSHFLFSSGMEKGTNRMGLFPTRCVLKL